MRNGEDLRALSVCALRAMLILWAEMKLRIWIRTWSGWEALAPRRRGECDSDALMPFLSLGEDLVASFFLRRILGLRLLSFAVPGWIPYTFERSAALSYSSQLNNFTL